jgi:hypothetical protein
MRGRRCGGSRPIIPSENAEHQQKDEDQQHQPDSPRRCVSPMRATAVRVKCPGKHEGQDNYKDQVHG